MKNKNIKLIALDIDGTIMNSQYQISERMRETILKTVDAGINVILATGRMYSSTVPIAQNLGIITPLITYQGSLIKEFYVSGRTLVHHTVSSELSKLIIKELRNFNVQINVYINDELYVENEDHILVEYVKRRHLIYHKVNSFDEISDLAPTKILAIDDNPDKITEIRDYLRNKYSKDLNINKSTPIYCEIVNNQASKGNSILYLAEKLDIQQSEIMVIGDHDNDIDMLKIAGISVAMGNGTEDLKKMAHYVTDTVDNDGAALAIECFALS